MSLAAIDIDGTEGARGAEVLAGSATYAAVGIDRRHQDRLVGILIAWHHKYGAGRTMAGAVAALHTTAVSHTVVGHDDGKADMDGRFLLFGDMVDGSGGAYLATTCTLGAAEATLERHLGLHEGVEFVRWT